MKLSIIVPVYNMAGEGKLEYCIQSLINQTLKDYEIIAVDDASTDDSLALLYRLQQKEPAKIKVIASPENRKQGGARNLGIRAAQGEFVGFMDADDWAAPDMFEKLVKKAQESGADVVGCDYSLVGKQTMQIGEVIAVNTAEQTGPLDTEKKKKLVLQPGSMVVKIYKKEIITENGLWFPEGIFYEDNCMAPIWMLHCRHFERVDEPLYFYYQHDASTVHHITMEKCRDRMKAMDLLIEKSREYGLYETFREELEYQYTKLYLMNTLFGLMPAHLKGTYGFLKTLVNGILEKFPDFARNPYYAEKTEPEEKKLIALLMKSQAGFLFYYRALWKYRKLRGKG